MIFSLDTFGKVGYNAQKYTLGEHYVELYFWLFDNNGGVTVNLITQDLSNVVLKNSVLKVYVGLNELKQDKYVKLKN